MSRATFPLALFVVFAGVLIVNVGHSPAEPLKVGVLVPLSGDGSASYGVQAQHGVLLAAKAASEPPIQLTFEDSKCTPNGAVTGAQKLIEVDKVQVIIGDACWTDVIAPIAERSRVVVISTGSAQTIDRKPGSFIFRLKLAVSVDSRELARVLRQRFEFKTASILYVGDKWGEGIAENFTSEFASNGGVVISESLFQRSDQDFRSLLARIKTNLPQVLVLAGYPENIGTIARQARGLGIQVPFAAYRGGLGTETVTLGGSSVEGMLFLEEFNAEGSPESRDFARRYRETYGEEPNLFAAMGYDAYELTRSAQAHCSGDTLCIKSFLYSLKDFPGVSAVLNFNNVGDVQKPTTLFTIREGSFVRY